jgi:hypothetical protein
MRHGRCTSRRRALGLIAAGSLAGTLARTGRASAEPRREVDLSLALGVDVSGSVNQIRFELQRRGYVEAFLSPSVLKAIKSGERGAIGVSMYQWTGPRLQVPAVPWFFIDDQASIRAFAARIARADRYLFGGGTSISGAIDYGHFMLSEAPFTGGRRVIDISGDGANNRGRPAADARDEAVAQGININGLPILELEPGLEEHYRRNVIGGPGAFVIAADTFADFADAIRRKLTLEIAGRPAARPGPTG